MAPTRSYTADTFGTSQVGLLITAFGATTSISIVSIGYVLLLLGFLINCRYLEKIKAFISSPLALPLLGLIIWAFVGALYSEAPENTLHRQLGIFARLGLVFLIFAAVRHRQDIVRAWHALLAGGAFTVLSTYLNIYFFLPYSITQSLGWGGDHTVFYNYISQSLVMAFVACVSLSKALDQTDLSRWSRLAWFVLAVLCAGSNFFLSTGRTGLIALLIGLLYVLWRRFGMRGAPWLVFFAVAGLSWMWVETSVGQRLAQGVNDLMHFQGIQDSKTSWGARLSMYLLSIKFIAEAPLFGHGLGDYQTLAMAYYQSDVMRAVSGYHPHNQYLYLWVELGLVGLGLYLWLHWRIWAIGRQIESNWSDTLVIFLIGLVTDSLFHAPFWMSGERNFFFPVLGLIAATGFHFRRPNAAD